MASVAEYTKMAQMLQLVPTSAANAAGFDYEMRPDLTQAESIRFETLITVCCCHCNIQNTHTEFITHLRLDSRIAE